MKAMKIYIPALVLCILGVSGTLAGAQESQGVQRDTIVNTLFGPEETWMNVSSVSAVKSEQLQKSFTQNVMNTLYGEIPGLTVMSGSGEPGSDSPTINARGFNTFNTSDRSVLIIVDGYEGTFNNLCIDEIESITLLKDAAATTLYGMRGANGVLLITTKRGIEGPLKVSFSAQAGVNMPFRSPKFLDSADYATLYNEARVNDGLAPFYSDEAIAAYANRTDDYLYPNVNWGAQILNPVSVNQNYDLHFRGGWKNVRFFTLLNISDNNGFFAQTDPSRQLNSNSKLTRYNIRTNIDVDITDNISTHLNLAANVADKHSPASGAYNVYNKLAQITPNAFPVFNPDGSYGGNATFSNPLGDLLETGFNSTNSRNLQADLSVDYKFHRALEGLRLNAGFSFRNWFSGDFNKSRKYPYFEIADASGDYVYNQYSETTDMSISDGGASQWRFVNYNANIFYDRTFGGVHLVSGAVQFFSDQNYTNGDTSVRDYQFPYKWLGVRGHLTYAFDKRYVAEVIFSEMGSDLYAKGHKWGFFPAAAFGWVISNENFLKDSKTVNYLKLRASFGSTGNATIVGARRYAYSQDYKYSAAFPKGSSTISTQYTMMEDDVADRTRTWETEYKANLGFESTFLGKLDFDFDVFLNKRNGVLTSPAGEIPSVLGLAYSYKNLGRSTNAGFELSTIWRDKCGDFEYFLRGNLWFARNRIDYMAEDPKEFDYQYKTGHRYDQGFGLKAIGLFHDQAEIDSAPVHTFSDVKPGDIRYEDANGDGFVDSDDAVAIGNLGNPELSASLVIGLKYKGFDFETMFYGVGCRTSYLSGNTYWAFMNQYSAPESALARWTPETADTAVYPRLSTMANANNTQYSSFWQVDGSFLKVRYVEFGYSLPEHACKAIKADSLRFFLNGTNLFSIRFMKGLANADPEGMGGFPQMRTVSLGIKAEF